MLILPPAVYDRRRRLLVAIEKGEISREAGYLEMLESDPDDYVVLVWLAAARKEAGDLVASEQYCWRAIQACPSTGEPYLAFVGLYPDDPARYPMTAAMAELGFSRMMFEEGDDDQKLDFSSVESEPELMGKLRDLPVSGQCELMAAALKARRDTEPPEVTERLRYLRLALAVEQEVQLNAAAVDEIIAAGEPMVPLLTAIARAWVRETISIDDDEPIRNSVALLGEMGNAENLPALLELTALASKTASGVARWAVGRLLERDTESWVRKVLSLSPTLDLQGRLTLLEHALAHPLLPGIDQVIRGLGADAGSMMRDDLDAFLSLYLVSTATSQWGLEPGREALRLHGAHLSPKSRRECNEALSSLTARNRTIEPPQASEFTVYEILAAEVDCSLEDEVFEEEVDEDEDFPEQPIVRAPKPGRNDSCWCGSGKKYKKCHLAADEESERSGVSKSVTPESAASGFESLRGRVAEVLFSLDRREVKQGTGEFLGKTLSGESEPEMMLADWLAHDWEPRSLGCTVMREFLRRYDLSLSRRERELVEAWAESYVGFYEVQDVQRGTGVTLKPLLAEAETFFAHDVNLSNQLARWDCIFARIVPGERGIEVTGDAAPVSRHILNAALEWLNEDRQVKGLPWPGYLKANWPRIRRQVFVMAQQWRDNVQIANSDGEVTVFSKAYYEVSRNLPVARFEACAELERDSSGRFAWLDTRHTVLGTIDTGNRTLTIECNSKERLARARALVEALAGASLLHVRDEFNTLKDLSDHWPTSSPDANAIRSEARRDAEAQALNEHYADWPERVLPALGGITPREAVKTPDGRARLIEVLKLLENGEEHKQRQGQASCDVNRVRKALGLNAMV